MRRFLSSLSWPTLLATPLVLLALSLTPVYASDNFPEPTKDEDGPDDEPGQKDLNSLAVDTSHFGTLWVRWTHDVTSVSGNNSADACALFDTDDDGKANNMLCAVWQIVDDELTLVGERFYTCGDTRTDRCTGGAPFVENPDFTHCELAVVDDAFGPRKDGQTDTSKDVQTTCSILLSEEIPNGRLTNVCSYPSQEPNSDPSDCVLMPDTTAFLTVIKSCGANISGDFSFELIPASNDPGGVGTFSLGCNHPGNQIGPLRISSANDYTLTETDPLPGSLVDIECTIGAEVVADAEDNTIELFGDGVTFDTGQALTCVVSNSAPAVDPFGEIRITKTGENRDCIGSWFFGTLGPFDLCTEDVFDTPPKFQSRAGQTIVFDELSPEAPPLPYQSEVVLTDLSNNEVIDDIAGRYVFWEKSPATVTTSRYSDFYSIDCQIIVDNNPFEDSMFEYVPYASVKIGFNPAYLAHLVIVDLVADEVVECTYKNVERGVLRITDTGVPESYTVYALTGGGWLTVADGPTNGDGIADRVECRADVEEYCFYFAPGNPASYLRPDINDIGFSGMYQLCPDTVLPPDAACTGFTMIPGGQLTLP